MRAKMCSNSPLWLLKVEILNCWPGLQSIKSCTSFLNCSRVLVRVKSQPDLVVVILCESRVQVLVLSQILRRLDRLFGQSEVQVPCESLRYSPG